MILILIGIVFAPASAQMTTRWSRLKARDGFELEYRESFSGKADPRLPAIVHFLGSGFSTLIHPLLEPLYERMADLGFTVISVNKRGIRGDPSDPLLELLADSEDIASFVLNDLGFKNRGIIVFGQSEGTVRGAWLADRFPGDIKGLFFVGTQIAPPTQLIEKQLLDDIAARTLTGNDKDKDGRLDREECASISAECIPAGKDSLVLEDLIRLREEHFAEILRRGDDRWSLGTIAVGTRFFREAYELESNESRLMRVTCPVIFFHGEKDSLARVEDLRRFERHVRLLGRSNFKFFYEPGMPHGLDLTRETALQGKPFYGNFFRELEAFKSAFIKGN
jgi:pimeloyl-ACP methyl ester carboxylesterase